MKAKVYFRITSETEFELNPGVTHKLVAVVDVESDTIQDIEPVYGQFQAESWSPNGEARELIRDLGLHHTSFSMGDAVVVGKKAFICDLFGWLEEVENDTTARIH